jgi:hypothetical protein
MYRLACRSILAIALFGLGGTLAIAKTAPQQQERGGAKVSTVELQHFATAVRSILTLSRKSYLELKKKTTPAQHQLIETDYSQGVAKILANNHLSVAQYKMLLTKSQSDPAFVKRTARAIQAAK